MKDILVIAPHPDDETLACGGAIAKWISQGHNVYWLVVTQMLPEQGYSSAQIEKRQNEITSLSSLVGFKETIILGYASTCLTEQNLPNLINDISQLIKTKDISTLVLPFRYDAHSDHKIVFDAGIACSKSFRYPSINEVLVYETLSETHYRLDCTNVTFSPNYYVDITHFIGNKKQALAIFSSEMGEHPFPRSIKNIEALATLRGAEAGCQSAEAFMLLKSIN